MMMPGGGGDERAGREAATASRSPAAGQTAGSPTKMVVLPFENLGSPDDEYFADGITDEITSRLAVIPGIAVISRTTARKYKETTKEIREIGTELGVDYVLEGTIRWDKTGEVNRVRITPQLIKVADDFNVWAQNYERQIDEIFTVQADIATRIAEALNLELLEGDKAAIETRPTENMEAYQFFLRGVAAIHQGDMSRPEIEEALVLFERALALDPSFADAFAWASRAHSGMVHFGYDRSETRLGSARGTAERALELDPQLVNAHVALGFYHYWGRKDYDPALAAAARALEIQDDFIPALELKAWSLRRMGRLEEATDILLRILDYSPGSAVTMRDIADTYAFLRRYDDASRYNELSIMADPSQYTAYRQWALVLCLQGDLARARVRLETMPEQVESSFWRGGWLQLYLLERNAEDLLAFADRSTDGLWTSQNIIVSRGEVKGLAYTFRGEPELARQAYEAARAPLDSIINANPSDYRAYMSLGRVYAGLGRRDAAIRNGEKGHSLYNPTVDALSGQFVVEDLAVIYAMLGDHDRAFDTIEKLLTSHAEFSVETFKLDPRYDGLRQHPRYAELLAKFGV
jgi:serine/threonine-protein kinase